MHRLMVRTPEIYRRMREASFMPGVWMTLFVAAALYVAEFILREITASILDYSYYAQQQVSNNQEAWQAVYDYVTSPWTMIAALLITSFMIIVTLVYVRGIEKRSLSTIGLVREGLARNFTAGYAIGLFIVAAAVLPGIAFRAPEYKGIMPVTAAFFLAFIVQAASEEVYFRGFMLSSLSAKGRFIPAALITSALFALLHAGNYGATPLYILDTFFAGILYAFYTLRTGSLWGAIGLHAAWNFALGLVYPISWGNLVTDYSAFKTGQISGSSIPGADLFYLVSIGLEIIVTALVLFAGKNKLAVRMSDERLMYLNALKTAKRSLKGLNGEDGRPLLRRALGIADNIYEEPAKAVALLYAACSGGKIASEELIGRGFSESVLYAVEELVASPKGMVYQNVKDPIAFAVVMAGVKYDDEHAADRRVKGKRRKDIFHCPLLRREIDSEYCKNVVKSVDEGKNSAEFAMFDTRICKSCPNRRIK